MLAKDLLDRFVRLVYPDRCLLCGQILEQAANPFYLCPHCTGHMTFLDEVPVCQICGVALPDGSHRLCDTCMTHPHYFDRADSCFSYEGKIRHAILRYKFQDHRELCRPFAALMLQRLLPLCQKQPFDMVVAAPLSVKTERQRGYNQAALLAERIADGLGLPFIENAFTKPLETRKQSSLHYPERMRNVENAFRLGRQEAIFQDKRIILVDDILTTGATADALSRLLKRAGASYVLAATIASTKPGRSQVPTREEENAVTF